jgi:hypothetical protein
MTDLRFVPIGRRVRDSRSRRAAIWRVIVSAMLLLRMAGSAQAQDAAATSRPYPVMAPVAQYRIVDPQDEIALARSAAPPSISAAAEVLVLGDHGYQTAVQGKNGFVCVVQRSWADAFDDPEFWNPKVRAPNCFNAAAVRSVLPPYLKLTEWVLAGVSKADMIERRRAALSGHTIAAPEPGSLVYMMSPRGYLNDTDGRWTPHLMFVFPATAASAWGANLPGSPVIAAEGSDLDPTTTFMIPVRRWSDGTLAPGLHAG